MLSEVVGAVRAHVPRPAQEICAATGYHLVEDVMTDKNRNDDLDLNEKGLINRAKGTAEEIKGRARNALGGLTGDTSEQLKGKGEELKGKAQQEVGKAQQKLDGALDDNDRKKP